MLRKFFDSARSYFSEPKAEGAAFEKKRVYLAKSPEAKKDVRNLVIAVSLAANGYLLGVLSEKSKDKPATNHSVSGFIIKDANAMGSLPFGGDGEKAQAAATIASLQAQVAKLRSEKSAAEAKLPKEHEVVITKVQLHDVLEYVEIQKGKIEKLETKCAPGKPSKKPSVPAVEKAPGNATGTKSQKLGDSISPTAGKIAVAQPVSDLVFEANQAAPEGSRVYAFVEKKGETRIVYRDRSGYARYFTFEDPSNRSRTTAAGMKTWMEEQYVKSLDLEFAKQAQKN